MCASYFDLLLLHVSIFISVQRFSQQLNNSGSASLGGESRIKEFARGRIVEIPSSSDPPPTVSFSGRVTSMIPSSNSNQVQGVGGGGATVPPCIGGSSPTKNYPRTPTSSRTIDSITPGGEITPNGTVTATPRITKPYPYPRSNAAAATLVTTSPISSPSSPPVGIIPSEQLLENQCDLCAKV